MYPRFDYGQCEDERQRALHHTGAALALDEVERHVHISERSNAAGGERRECSRGDIGDGRWSAEVLQSDRRGGLATLDVAGSGEREGSGAAYVESAKGCDAILRCSRQRSASRP